MRTLIGALDGGSKTASYLLGFGVLGLAAAVFFTPYSVPDITGWAREVLGLGFMVLLATPVALALLCWVKLLHEPVARGDDLWLEAGVQAANGVTTLALTFTLLGIRLGIGSLAGQELNPDTVPVIIRKMTANFSLAFMTTVVGLPVSAVLRSLILVTHARNRRWRTEHPNPILGE